MNFVCEFYCKTFCKDLFFSNLLRWPNHLRNLKYFWQSKPLIKSKQILNIQTILIEFLDLEWLHSWHVEKAHKTKNCKESCLRTWKNYLMKLPPIGCVLSLLVEYRHGCCASFDELFQPAVWRGWHSLWQRWRHRNVPSAQLPCLSGISSRLDSFNNR